MSGVHYQILSGFKTVNTWQKSLLKNAAGLLQAGYMRENMHFGGTPTGHASIGHAPTVGGGGRGATAGGSDSLSLSGTSISFTQGDIQPAFNPTSLAVKGQGFFLVAENLRPGAKLYLTRAGDFRYDTEGRLVNPQGLFVVGGGGTLSDPPTPVRDPGDGTVRLADVSLARVPVPNNLAASGYGPVVFELTAAAGPMAAYPSGRPEVGFIQPSSLEMPDRTGGMAQIQVETNYAQQAYKMFKDLLDNYNRATDDAIGTVR